MRPAALEMVEWMRKEGIRRARWGDLEVEFERVPAPRVDPAAEKARLKTADEIAAERREERRRQYSMELGVAVTDEMLERLP